MNEVVFHDGIIIRSSNSCLSNPMAKAMFVNTYAENYGRVVLKSRNSFQSPVAEEKEPVSSRRKSSKGSNRRRGSVDPKMRFRSP